MYFPVLSLYIGLIWSPAVQLWKLKLGKYKQTTKWKI